MPSKTHNNHFFPAFGKIYGKSLYKMHSPTGAKIKSCVHSEQNYQKGLKNPKIWSIIYGAEKLQGSHAIFEIVPTAEY